MKRNVSIKANNVNVAQKPKNPPSAGSVNNSNSSSNNRNKRRNRKGKINTAEQAIVESERDGMMTNQSPRSSALLSWRNQKIELSENACGWYYKYCDPAGAVESGRCVGECGKIPDGLVKYSVDAEIREIYNDSCPGISDSSVPLDGKLWSYTIISFPMFRLCYIAVANNLDKELTDPVVIALVRWLNNLVDWRTIVESDDWSSFYSDDTSWYARLRVLRPTYDLGDSSSIRTVASWRMTYKSITTETNAPSLINQGFWIGGHFAQDNVLVDRSSQSESGIILDAGTQTTLFASYAGFVFTFSWVGLSQGGTNNATGNPHWVANNSPHFAWRFGANPGSAPNGGVSYVLPSDTSLSTALGTTPPGDTITARALWDSENASITLNIVTSAGNALVALVVPSDGSTTAASVLKIGGVEVEHDSQGLAFRVELPPVNMEQMAPNNPKIEQFLIKDTEGSYLVHSKMRNPVFQLTPAKTFGSLTLDYPGYDTANDLAGPLGIRDSFDANFSTGVVVYRGLSQACTMVNKVYQGWEGVTASHTPFGQFGHSGLPVNQPILDLADDLAGVRLTGIYPAVDNFAAAVAGLASSMLSQALKSEATQAAISGIGSQATQAVSRGIANLPSLVGSLIGRVGNRIRARRLARSRKI